MDSSRPVTLDLDALASPSAFAFASDGAASVEILHTHVSALFFVGDRVYKVKKPVRFDFIDATTLDARKWFCDEEVRLNAALAPGIYLGVVPIRLASDGTVRVGRSEELADGDRTMHGDLSEIVEWAVEMRRLPADRLLDAIIDRGELTDAMIDALVEALAHFHETCPRDESVAKLGDPARVRSEFEENLTTLGRFRGPVERAPLTGAMFERLRDRTDAWLSGHADLLARRAATGHVHEGHGDLHAGNIAILADRVVAYDRIEFSRPFRCRDVAGEFAYLAMDLARRGERALADRMLARIAERLDDPGLLTLAPGFERHLALVRAKVTALESADPAIDRDAKARAVSEARRFVLRAIARDVAPAIVLTCGIPGSGKSVLARAVASTLDATLVRSDVERKRLAGIEPTEHPTGVERRALYTPEMTARTYGALLESAQESIETGRTVVVDAASLRAAERAPFIALARSASVPFALAEATCDEVELERRLAARTEDPTEVSDADLAIARLARDRLEPPTEVPTRARAVIRSDVDPDDVAVARVVEALLAN